MRRRFPCRPRAFADAEILSCGTAAAEKQTRAIQKQRVVAGRQVGELQARGTAGGLRRDEMHIGVERPCAARAYEDLAGEVRGSGRAVRRTGTPNGCLLSLCQRRSRGDHGERKDNGR